MSLYARAKKAAQAFLMRHPGAQMALSWLLPRTRFDYAREVGDGTGSSIVMAVVGWICRTFPEAGLVVVRLERDGTRTRQVGHRMALLIERPNDAYSGVLLWMATLLDWLIDGNAYWLKVRNGYGAVIALWWAPSWTMAPAWPEDGSQFISHFEYCPDGREWRPIARADVVHFRYGMDPRNPRKGIAPLRSLFREIFTDDEAANFTAALLKNLGIPGVIIAPDGDDTSGVEIDAEGIKTKYVEKFSGDRRGEPMVMTSKIKVVPLSFNPQQMDLKALRRIPEERVTAVLGLPAIVAGLGAGLDRSTFANFKEAREAAYESNIIPTQRLFAAELKTQLLPDFADADAYDLEWDLSRVRVLQEDEDARHTRARGDFSAGVITLNQALARIGEQPDPAGDYYLRPGTLVAQPYGVLPPPPAAAVAALAAPGKGAFGPPETKASGARLVRRLARDAARLQAQFGGDLAGSFEDLGAAVKVRVAKKARAAKAAGDVEIISDTLTGGEIVEVEIPKDVTTAFKTVYESNFERILETTAGTIEQHLGVPVGINLEDPRARELIGRWATRKGLADVNQQTRDAVMAALKDGREAGDGAYALGKRIRGMVEGRHMYPGVYQEAYDAAIKRGWGEEAAGRAGDRAARQFRAETIARSETKTAQNYSSVEAYINSEVVEGLIVYDGTDDDDACREANGQIWSFEKGLERAIEHPRCVRAFAPQVRKTVQ
jgi:HK97 family phage portal protein